MVAHSDEEGTALSGWSLRIVCIVLCGVSILDQGTAFPFLGFPLDIKAGGCSLLHEHSV